MEVMEVSQIDDLDFKSKFYNLQGFRIEERKKNFYRLLKSASPDTTEDQIDIQPRNYLERIFYVDVLIHFKKVNKLIEILKEGNGVLTSKILKQKWFFQSFKNMSEENIVNNFLPSLSFPLRMKVLKKLSLALDENKMDKIFDLTLERYGPGTAQRFLFSCSKDKIIYVMRNYEICLESEQLKRILQKDIYLIKVYFEEYKKNTKKDFNNSDFISYMTWKHPDLYFEMELNTKCQKRLGRYTTRAVLKNNKENVLKDLESSRWNKSALVRELKDFEKEYLKIFFPDKIDYLKNQTQSSILATLISKYPIKRRWGVLSQGFKTAYNKEITENLQLFHETLAKLFPKEIKQNWAEIRYREYEDLKYVKYFKPKKAFELLKNKINVTSDIHQRARLINELITVCHENKDYSTYVEVLKYICTRHRNEDQARRSNIISHIEKNIDYNLLTEEHWKYINEMIDLQRVRGEKLSWEFVPQYMKFLYKNKIPFGEPVTQLVKDCINDDRSFYWFMTKEEDIDSATYRYIVKTISTLEIEKKRKGTIKLMDNIVEFNIKIDKEFSKCFIDLNECPPIVDLIRNVFEKKEAYNNDDCDVVKHLLLYHSFFRKYRLQIINEDKLVNTIIEMCNNTNFQFTLYIKILEAIKKPKRENFENRLLEYFFTHINEEYQNFLKAEAIEHFLKKEPEVVVKYFDTILSIDVKGYILSYNVIKKYSYLKLDEKLVTYFKDFVHLKSKYERKVQLLVALSKVMDTKDYLDLVKDYTPQSIKLDLENEEQRELYAVQCKIAKAFKNLDDPVVVAPVLMHFCQGDYLQSSLSTLYKVLYGLNERNVSTYINVLGARAMSTRKHSVFLSFELLALKDAITTYSVLSNKETNISAKKYLFDAILKYFLKNPLETIFNIVFLNMSFINKDDSEMIEGLVQSTKKIPNKYKPKFIEKVWNYLEVLERQDVDVSNYRNTLISTMNTYDVTFFLKLNKSFSDNIIKQFFLSCDDTLLKCSDALKYFVINYLLAYLGEQQFDFIFNIIKSYKDSHWHGNDRKKIGHIFSLFSIAYAKFDKNNDTFLTLFKKFWQQTFNHEECFSEYVLLELMLLYKKNSDLKVYAKEVDTLFQKIIQEYGTYTNELLVACIENFFLNIDTDGNNHVYLSNFAFYLLESNCSDFNCFAVYSIVKRHYYARQHVYSKVLGFLQNIDTNKTRIYCNLILKR